MAIMTGNPIISSFLLISLLTVIPSSSPLSFYLSFSDLDEMRQAIKVEGNAYISTQGIQVTSDERSVDRARQAGRATYIQPLHLWDRASGNLTDFTTHFTFVIDSSGSQDLADGLAFFLGPNGTIPEWSYGGSLGIGNGSEPYNSSVYSFVAVEFDTYMNFWDPNDTVTHVGVDVNSMASVNATAWLNNITQGSQNDAWISYSGSSKVLRADFTGFWQNATQRGSVSYALDLRDYLPEYVAIGFTAATGDLFEKHNVKTWEFSSNLEINPITSPEPTAGPGPGPGPGNPMTSGHNKTRFIVGLSVGLPIAISGVALASYYWLWRKKHRQGPRDGEEDPFDPIMDIEFGMGTGPKRFSYAELARATNNFSEGEKLGEGGFGGVYRGFSRETNSYIAVKRVAKGSKQGLKEYASEVKIISQLRHRNLVQLIGWCHERGELLLVYEYMPNGSLDYHLFKPGSVLTWAARYKLVQGLASALLYLHEEWERCVVHRDIKSSNVMLDSGMNARLGDFGLARLVDHEKGAQTTVLAGTIGYMAPECNITGRASKETDAYSFGVVLLEIACGRRPIESKRARDEVVLVEWIWGLHGARRLLEGVDLSLEGNFDREEAGRVMEVGLWCVHPDAGRRPTMREVARAINFEVDIPELPSGMPVPTYLVPSDSKYSDFYSGWSKGTSSSTI